MGLGIRVPQLVTAENHPYHPNDALREYLSQYGIVIEVWYPLGHGDAALHEEPVFAVSYGSTSGARSLSGARRTRRSCCHTGSTALALPGTHAAART